MMSLDVVFFTIQARTPFCRRLRSLLLTRMPASKAQMDLASRAMCYALRNPPPGTKKSSCKQIAALIVKTDGTHPSEEAVRVAAKEFGKEKEQRGRKEGYRKTTTKEDRVLMKKFKQLRPPGHGITSRKLHRALPAKLRRNICRKTVIRRLADKGYTPHLKSSKGDPDVALCRKRVEFARRYAGMTSDDWQRDLQAVGDIKEFSFYPPDLKPRHRQLQARWTYMTKEEKKKPAFTRPKRWFKQSEWRRVIKQKVFGFTTSTGQKLAFLVPEPWNSEQWATEVTNQLKPFLSSVYPGLQNFQILLDGEAILHGPPARAAMDAAGITVLPGWPSYSPDLNPQENVWAWSEKRLRDIEVDTDTFVQFQAKVLRAVCDYPVVSGVKLVAGMGKRFEEVIEAKGAMLDY